MAEKKPKLAVIKTKPTATSVEEFINNIPDEQRQKDSLVLFRMMKDATGVEPVIWSNSTIGFGNKRYKSPTSGREVDWYLVGFSPRKANLTVYLIDLQRHAEALKTLGKHKAGGGCLYINKLEDVDLKILREMINVSAK